MALGQNFTPPKRPNIKQNFLSPVEFRLVINRLPYVTFFVQSATVPGLAGNPVEMGSSFSKYYVHGDNLDFSTFSIQIRVDENMASYLEIMNWMLGLNYPEKFDQYSNLTEAEGLYSDATLTILTNSKNPNVEVKMINMFPISLSEVQMDTTQEGIEGVMVDITFQIDRFEIDVLNS